MEGTRATAVLASRAGYSLIEILVACALAGALFGAAAPRLPPMMASFALRNTTFQVANDLRLARQRAIATNGKGRIVFSSGSYRLRRESPVGSNTFVDDGAPRPVPAGTSLSSDSGDPTFDSRGLTNAPYAITVNNGYSTKTITVSAIGRVAVD
jgi:Tfp pilus assembly protein FimT